MAAAAHTQAHCYMVKSTPIKLVPTDDPQANGYTMPTHVSGRALYDNTIITKEKCSGWLIWQ